MPETIPSPTIAILAGEDSGDQLGADLIVALRQRYPAARFVGIGGKRMQAQDFESWHDIHELSLFGFAEVVRHLPRLLKLRKTLVARLLETRPDVVIGIDAPDFNLGVEQRLKQAGLRTVHYVSPSVWAWREKRAEKIGRSADRVLCLFPMEPAIYARHGIDARFVGHPLADRFALVSDRAGAREILQLPHDVPVLALLPGSRPSELARMGSIFIDAARRVAAALPGLRVVIPAANPQVLARLRELLAKGPHDDHVLLFDGHAHEAMLAKRPMVAGYRVSPLSYRVARALNMLKTDVYTLPNILARAGGMGEDTVLVPELMQADFTAAKLADATLALFNDSERRGHIVAAFEQLHRALRGELGGRAGDQAASAIAELLDGERDAT
jgi:lipid-A-disaccharide synthase